MMQDLKRSILDVIVAGHSESARVIIKKIDAKDRENKRKNKESTKKKEDKYYLFTEGYGLKKVMNTEGVKGEKTRTNSVLEVFDTLGIEAAKSVIISEIKEVMGSMDIDNHHIQLLATTMTRFGEITGITRFGLAKTRDSVLQLASFEKTPDHLFDAASGMKTDRIQGVSENIIMGQPVKLGTGLASVVMPLELTDEFVQRRDPFWSVGKKGVIYELGHGQQFRI
jgi:DNA-directed RNA polymerase III subunit RPC1